jgi:hypothetical protein
LSDLKPDGTWALHFRGKVATTENFKLKILICFNSSIIEHGGPLHPHNFPHFVIKLSNFCNLGKARWGGLQMFFELEKQRENV